MPFFRVQSDGDPRVATFGRSTEFQGTLEFDGDLVLRGRFGGSMEVASTVVVDRNAAVDVSRLKARSVVVAGTLSGEIEAAERVEFRPSASMRGSVVAPVVAVDDGAGIDAVIRMSARRPLR